MKGIKWIKGNAQDGQNAQTEKKKDSKVKEWFKENKTKLIVTGVTAGSIVGVYAWYKLTHKNTTGPVDVIDISPIKTSKPELEDVVTKVIEPPRKEFNISPNDICMYTLAENLNLEGVDAEKAVAVVRDADAIKSAFSNYIDGVADKIDISKIDDITVILEKIRDMDEAYEGIEVTCF